MVFTKNGSNNQQHQHPSRNKKQEEKQHVTHLCGPVGSGESLTVLQIAPGAVRALALLHLQCTLQRHLHL